MTRNKKQFRRICSSLFLLTVIIFSLGFTNIHAENNINDVSIQKKIISLKLDQTTNINLNNIKTEHISYYSLNNKVATVDINGNITANMIGSTKVMGRHSDGTKVQTIVIVYRDLLEPLSQIQEPRYTLKNEVYVNEDAEETNDALLMFTGDLMCQTRQQEAAKTDDGTYIFNDSFNMVKEIFSEADFVAGNLESLLSNTSPYMSEEKSLGGKPHCNGPSTYLDALRYAGFDALVNANNHIIDDGETGIIQTLNQLDKYKFAHTGSFKDKKEQRFLMFNINGIKVALMSYSEKFNGKDVNLDEDVREVMLNRYTKEAVEQDVKDAKSMGAEYIIAYNHWGNEYKNNYNEKQKKSAREMAEAGVDYIIGSHPHALQTADVITTSDNRQVPVAYSLGNFLSHQTKLITKDNFILTLRLKKDNDGKVYLADEGYIPCYVYEKYGNIPYLVMPISKEFNGGIEDKELKSSYERIKKVIDGSILEIKSYEKLKD